MSEKRRLKFILKFFLDEYLKIENGKVRVDKETADLIYRVIVYIISRLEKELTPDDDKLRAYLYYAKTAMEFKADINQQIKGIPTW